VPGWELTEQCPIDPDDDLESPETNRPWLVPDLFQLPAHYWSDLVDDPLYITGPAKPLLAEPGGCNSATHGVAINENDVPGVHICALDPSDREFVISRFNWSSDLGIFDLNSWRSWQRWSRVDPEAPAPQPQWIVNTSPDVEV